MFKKNKKSNSKVKFNDNMIDMEILKKKNNKDLDNMSLWDLMYPLMSVMHLAIVVFNILLERYNTQNGLFLIIFYIFIALYWIVLTTYYFIKARKNIKKRIDIRNNQIKEIRSGLMNDSI